MPTNICSTGWSQHDGSTLSGPTYWLIPREDPLFLRIHSSGACGLTAREGLPNVNGEEVELKRAIVDAAKEEREGDACLSALQDMLNEWPGHK